MWAKCPFWTKATGTKAAGERWIVRAVALILVSWLAPPAWAAPAVVFGPQSYTRSTGAPVTVTSNFTVASPANPYVLHLDNGGANGEFSRVTSATVSLNGVEILKPSDFNQNVGTLDRQVTLSG